MVIVMVSLAETIMSGQIIQNRPSTELNYAKCYRNGQKVLVSNNHSNLIIHILSSYALIYTMTTIESNFSK